MLARDWYYNQRRRFGLDNAVASIYDRDDDGDSRARAALGMLGVEPGWRVAEIGCGNGVLACEAALMGAEVDAVDISPAMLVRAYLGRTPAQLVARLRIDPGEAYIVNADDVIHDGASDITGVPDVALHFLGHFGP